MKKFISIVMALVMVIGCFSVMAFAEVNDAVCKIEIKPTETSYKKGDVVTFEVWLETTNEIGLLGGFDSIFLGYDSSVYESLEASDDEGWTTQQTVITEGYPCDNNFVQDNDSWVQRDAKIISPNEVDTAKGWDKILWINMTPMGDAPDDDYCGNPAACFAFKMKIKEDASDTGCYAIGVANASIVSDPQTMVNEELGAFGGMGADWEFSTTYCYECVDGTAVVKAAAVDPAYVAPLKNQIRYTGITKDANEKPTGTFVPGTSTFDVRACATLDLKKIYDAGGAMSAAEVEAAATADADIRFGFVFAMDTAGTFDIDAAKAVAEAGASSGIYTYKECTFVQRTSDGYMFTCLVTGLTDLTANSNVNVIGFAYANGQYSYFAADEVVTAQINVPVLVGAYPYAVA